MSIVGCGGGGATADSDALRADYVAACQGSFEHVQSLDCYEGAVLTNDEISTRCNEAESTTSDADLEPAIACMSCHADEGTCTLFGFDADPHGRCPCARLP